MGPAVPLALTNDRTQPKLRRRDVVPNDDEDARTVIDDVCEIVDPVAIDYRHGWFPRSICGRLLMTFTAELAAMRRGLSYDDFNDEFTELATQLVPRRASPADKHARPCVLIVHLEVMAWLPHDDLQSRIVWVHWNCN